MDHSMFILTSVSVISEHETFNVHPDLSECDIWAWNIQCWHLGFFCYFKSVSGSGLFNVSLKCSAHLCFCCFSWVSILPLLPLIGVLINSALLQRCFMTLNNNLMLPVIGTVSASVVRIYITTYLSFAALALNSMFWALYCSFLSLWVVSVFVIRSCYFACLFSSIFDRVFSLIQFFHIFCLYPTDVITTSFLKVFFKRNNICFIIVFVEVLIKIIFFLRLSGSYLFCYKTF
jgi:hypothetical protein